MSVKSHRYIAINFRLSEIEHLKKEHILNMSIKSQSDTSIFLINIRLFDFNLKVKDRVSERENIS